jgi:leucine dehydrogenase
VEEGAQLIVADTYEPALDRAREIGATIVEPEAIYDTPCDIFSPWALGGALNSDTIPRLRCAIVAGGANNQLLADEDGDALHRHGILYAPDFAINAGGIINAAHEMGGEYRPERAREVTERIFETIERVMQISRREDIPTYVAANRLAEQRLEAVRSLKSIYR